MSVSLRAAINAKCKDCIYDPLAGGTWLAQVAVCSSPGCPLWPVRPGPRGVEVPREPGAVSPDWIRRGHAEAIAALRQNTPKVAEIGAELAPSQKQTPGEVPEGHPQPVCARTGVPARFCTCAGPHEGRR
jgi:hypothetical protein